MSRLRPALAFCAAALAFTATTADAAVIVKIWDNGTNLFAEASGSVLLGGSSFGKVSGAAFLSPSGPSMALGDRGTNFADGYAVTNTGAFGTRNIGSVASTGGSASGTFFGFSSEIFYIDEQYVSGLALRSSATWLNRTIASGLTAGVYTYSTGADTITLAIGDEAISSVAAVPVPAAAPLLLGALGLFGVAARRKR